MSDLKLLKNPLTNNYLDLKKDIFGPTMAWLYQNKLKDYIVDGFDGHYEVPLYYHNVLQRPDTLEEYSNLDDDSSRIRSGAYDRFKTVINEIFDANDIKVKHYYRIAVNSCYNVNKHLQSPVHVDHAFPHKQMLIYLTDSSAATNIYTEKFVSSINAEDDKFLDCYYFGEEKKDILLKIFPHEDQIVSFDGLYYHSYDYPMNDLQRRIVIVCTYD